MDKKELKEAKAVYKSLCAMLDGKKFHYTKDEESLTIHCEMRGDDLPINLIVRIDTERKLVTLASPMPFEVPEERRPAMAVAVSCANHGLVDGSFDYNYLSGKILFRMTSSYRASVIGKDLFDYMIMCSSYTIDDYNDKFLVVAKTEMKPSEILEYVK